MILLSSLLMVQLPLLQFSIYINAVGWIKVSCNDPIFLALKPRQSTIYRNPQSAHKWTVENFLWTEEKQTVNSLNHGVDYFFDLTEVRAFLQKQNKLRSENVSYCEGRPDVGPEVDRAGKGKEKGNGKGKRPSNIVIVGIETYVDYIDDSGDECTDNLATDTCLPDCANISLLSAFDKNVRLDLNSTSTSAVPVLESLHIGTTTSQPFGLTSVDNITVDLQQYRVEVSETLGQKSSTSSMKKISAEDSSKAEEEKKDENVIEIGNDTDIGNKNEPENEHKICPHGNIRTDSSKTAGDRVAIDLDLIADVTAEVEVKGLGVTGTRTRSSAVNESSSSSSSSSGIRYTDLSTDDSEGVREQEKLDLAYRRTAKRLSRGYVTLCCMQSNIVQITL